jgi:antitoxin VapB
MALNIKDPATERLAAEVAQLASETKTGAIRRALEERRERLAFRGGRDRREQLLRFLAEDVWPLVPKTALGRRLSKRQREVILGYGPEGV